MNKKYQKVFEQQLIVLEQLQGDAKKEYYVDFFTNTLMCALKLRRQEENLSQKDIAKLMGVKQSYVSKIENLEKVPTLKTIAKYCYALNFSSAEIQKIATTIARKKEPFY